MSEYHLFRNTVSSKNRKKIRKWYYWFYDESGRQIKRACKNCETKAEAEVFITNLPPLNAVNKTIAQVTEFMYIPGSTHYNRCLQFGKELKSETLANARTFIGYIVLNWGSSFLQELTSQNIQSVLLTCDKSGSWKNRVLEIFSEIYREAAWQGIKVSLPVFTRFKRNSRKQSILSTREMEQLFKVENFSDEMFYVFFLLCLSAGMRLGEVRAFRVCQFLEDKQAVIIDGFLSKEGERNPFNKTGSVDNPRFRVALIPQTIVSVIRYWIRKNELVNTDCLFTYNNKPVRMELAEKEFRRALKKAQIHTEDRKLTPHALRYTYVTRTRRLVDTQSTMLMSGHSSEQMSDYYNRFELDETLKLLQPLTKAIDKFYE